MPDTKLSRGERVMAFMERYLKVPEGQLVGQPLHLEPFQEVFIRAVYDNPATTRRAYLSLGRKNGKTSLIAGMVLAHIIGPEARQNASIVSGAMSRDQAALVYSQASRMVMQSEQLTELVRTVPSAKRLVGLTRAAEYRALSADASTAHGLSPILVILDEVGQVRGSRSDFVDALTTSQGAHESPLLVAISTSAPSDADMFSLWCDDAERSNDPHTVCHVYRADADCDLLDRTQWRKANPALGCFRVEADLAQQLEQAARIPSQEAKARNLLLNQRVAQTSLWLAPGIWKSNSAAPDLDVFRDHPVALGLDLSARQDLTAAVIAARDDMDVVHLLPFVFTPQEGLESRAMRDRAPYDAWVRSGDLIAVPGQTIDYPFVAGWLRRQLDEMRIDITSIQFDRWRWEAFKVACEAVGFAVGAEFVPVGQGFRDISPRMEAFESLLLAGRIRHGGHPLLTMAASNTIAVQDPAGNRKMDKSKSTQRIDPLVAAVMAVYAVSEGEGGANELSADEVLFV